MASGRLGLAGAHALSSVTVKAVVLEVNIEIAQVPLQRLEASVAKDTTQRTSIASTTVLVSSGNVKYLNMVKTLRN